MAPNKLEIDIVLSGSFLIVVLTLNSFSESLQNGRSQEG